MQPSPHKIDRQLKLVCKCGYRKLLSDEFAGKKVACPKCSTVVRIPRANQEAEVLVRCPYCKDIDDLNVENLQCNTCERKYLLPEALSRIAHNTPVAAKASPHAKSPPPVAIPVQNAPNDQEEVSLVVDAPEHSNQPYAPYRRKRRSNVGLVLTNLLLLALVGLSGYLLWDKLGEELGLRDPVNPSTQTDTADAEDQEEGTDDEAPLPPPPKLTSPSVEIVGIENEVAQALQSETNEVVGTKLFVEVKIRNLSPCKITKIEARIQLLDGPIRRKEVSKVFEFKTPLDPDDARFAPAMFPVQSMTGAKITIERVWAGDQSDSTKISKEFNPVDEE